jgi:hypothetical protein
MRPTPIQPLAIYRGQALALCWLVQQPLGEGGEILAGLTRTLAFSRPVSGAEWAAVPRERRERAATAFHRRVLRLFQKGLAIRCPAVATVRHTTRGIVVKRSRDPKSLDQGLLQLLEAQGHRLRRCRCCGAWFWRERKREYCGPCFQSGTARSRVHRAKIQTAKARTDRPPASTAGPGPR